MMDGRKLAVHVESSAEAEAEGQVRPGSPPPLVLDRSLMREFDAVLERLDGIVDMDRYFLKRSSSQRHFFMSKRRNSSQHSRVATKLIGCRRAFRDGVAQERIQST